MRVEEVADPAERSRICETILRSLPDWFGIESAIVSYAEAAARLPTFVARSDGDPEPGGLLSVKVHNPYSAELYVMGVRPELHGQGLGTALVAAAEESLRKQGVEYFQVKTLGPSRPDAGYERTRQFYERRGFRPLEELIGFWDANPCLILVKRL